MKTFTTRYTIPNVLFTEIVPVQPVQPSMFYTEAAACKLSALRFCTKITCLSACKPLITNTFDMDEFIKINSKMHIAANFTCVI